MRFGFIFLLCRIVYYQAASQKAFEHSFAYTGNVENVELRDRDPVSIQNPTQTQISKTIFGAKTILIVVYCT